MGTKVLSREWIQIVADREGYTRGYVSQVYEMYRSDLNAIKLVECHLRHDSASNRAEKMRRRLADIFHDAGFTCVADWLSGWHDDDVLCPNCNGLIDFNFMCLRWECDTCPYRETERDTYKAL